MEIQNGYIAYIVNPKSGAGTTRIIVERFRESLCAKGYDVRVSFTDSLKHACELSTAAAVDYDCKLIIAAGGDGTIREVAHGLEGADKPLMIIPCGTENLLANELGIDKRVKTLIKIFESSNVRTLDLGKANGQCFTSIIGVGFDGDIVKLVSNKRVGHINHMHYFLPIWKTFWEHDFPEVKVVIDGGEVFSGKAMVFVGNISRYAIGLQILHYADFGDGLLDVCIYKCTSRPQLLKHSLLTVFKLHADRKDVIYRQGKTVEITSDDPNVNIEIDGDPADAPALPMGIEIMPQAVKVLVGPHSKPAGIRTRIKRLFTPKK